MNVAVWVDRGKELLAQFNVRQWVVAYIILSIPVLISWLVGLKVELELMSSALRASVQLLFIGIILFPIFQGPPVVQVLLLVIMVVLGAFIAAERGKNVRHSFWIALMSISVSFGVGITVFIISGSLDIAPNVIIPISGMLIGNAVKHVSLSYHRTAKDFENWQSTVEAMLIDGAEIRMALRIPERETLTNALVPAIDSLKTLGIVHIPGAMAGMMVAGASPLQAAGYQVLIFFGIVGVGSFASILSNSLAYRSVFRARYPHLCR